MLQLEQLLKERILILDGGMGSMIQQYHLTEADYRGTTFAHLPGSLQGNSEALNITRPDIIQAIHRQYLEAGADIIETNTLNATSISMADYGMENYVRELNLAAVRVAKEAVDQYTRTNPDQSCFVAGSIGPTNKTASLSPDVSNPAFRNITFDELYAAYREQIDALIDGGVDALLIETSFDTLNVKAALMAAEEVMAEKGKEVALMLSYTLAGKSGRILSGQMPEAALVSVSHAKLLSIGLNCSFGAKEMKPFLKKLGRIAPCYISAYPNAGLPNSLGQYDETPETMAAQVKEYLDEGLVDIIGGCCGTTPAHIAAIAHLVRQKQYKKRETDADNHPNNLQLSGLDVLNVKPFTLVGERCNVAGSKKFLRLIQEKNYEEALNIARKQVDDGAQILDINVDDGLLDGVHEITHFLSLIASEPDIAKVPIMVDSSDWNIIEAGLKCLQGKSVVNSISLKNGEEDFLKKAKKIKSHGAAVIAMAFDEKGQADTFDRKIEVCERMYRLLTQQAGFTPRNIIFDPNILAIGTGIEAHNLYAVDFIRATEWIKKNLPEAKVSGGVSNLSFSFRGNNYLREAIHAVFLYHAIQKGMDMAIVNPSTAVTYEDITESLRKAIEDLIFNRTPDATEKLTALAQTTDEASAHPKAETQEEWRTLPVADRLKYALLKGVGDYLETDLQEALAVYPKPVAIIDQPLMEGMNAVGQLFGDGKMFLPQVVKTARTMKKAVAILQPYIEANKEENSAKAGKVLIATVKGDVHDIGKNIAGVILSCNNYEVIDLGVMVPPEEILQKALEYQVDIIALSGLITPSLQEMSFVASEMEKAGFTKPLLVGGATTSPLHTALKIAPLYHGAVIHATDASKAIPGLNQILNPETQESYIETLKSAQQALRDKANNKKERVSLEYAKTHTLQVDHTQYQNPKPPIEGNRVIDSISIQEVTPFMDWAAFLAAWKLPVKYARYTPDADVPETEKDKFREALQVMDEARQIINEWIAQQADFIKAIIGFYPVRVEDESIIIQTEKIPILRQQERREDDVYQSLVDFIRPEGDYIGLFTVTAGEKNHPKDCTCGCRTCSEDPYREMLEQILKDRLVEAATEYLHKKVLHCGIRPASGYPSLPDLSLNFTINKILQMNKIGVTLTANGALYPKASTAGLFIAHPEAKYFFLGSIGDDQLADYVRRTGRSLDETRKWLAACL
ncbi:MAG: methionine synthase [Dysgonamonadaceae bacterium]|nr:methionine synthase [Dysgonamonadaceae bacterium]